MAYSKIKILFFCFFILLLCGLLYSGIQFYLYAQENKKEELDKPLASQELAAADEGQVPEGATAEFTEDLPPTEEAAPAKKKPTVEPITVNGDKVEYSADAKEVTASGDVEIDFKESKLTCQKITLNTLTKEGQAQGNVRLQDPRGIIKGSKITYNFQNKTGSILDATFMASPYFGKARRLEKLSETEFIGLNSYATTCSYDKPHYRINTKKIDFFRGDKLQAKDASFFFGNIPLLYVPSFSRSFKDPLMHLQVTPGNRKEWGQFVLNTWRTNLTDTLDARVYLDYRRKLGLAEGIGFNFNSQNFGKADLKFYYTDEKPRGSSREYQRYLARWRQKWDIDERTNLISEFYKIRDEKRKLLDPTTNILKDYFYREYEKDSQPLSYGFFHHFFPNSSFDLLAQYRNNHWYDQLTKLPEARFTLPSYKIGATPFYFEVNTSAANFDKKATTVPVTPVEENVARLDNTNRIMLPLKAAFLELTPFAAARQTLYDKGADGKSLPCRTVFYGGIDLSTKFYRLYNVDTKFLGLDIKGLRHVITPTIEYSYNNKPSVSSSELKQIDDIDLIEESNAIYFGLSNKLQTKRNGKSVDFLDIFISGGYDFKPRYSGGSKFGGKLQDIFCRLKLLPFSWLRLEADSEYDTDNEYFTEANYDINFNFSKGRSLGIGQRYARSGGNQITGSLNWRFNPKWKFYAYGRYELGHESNLVKGMAEQQYVLTRDLHCWEVGFAFDRKKNEGSTFWMVFRLKAFPGMEFNFDQIYHKPESGSD